MSLLNNRSKKIKKEETRGRKRITTKNEDKIIIKTIEKNNRKSWKEIIKMLADNNNILISEGTLISRAREHGI